MTKPTREQIIPCTIEFIEALRRFEKICKCGDGKIRMILDKFGRAERTEGFKEGQLSKQKEELEFLYLLDDNPGLPSLVIAIIRNRADRIEGELKEKKE